MSINFFFRPSCPDADIKACEVEQEQDPTEVKYVSYHQAVRLFGCVLSDIHVVWNKRKPWEKQPDSWLN